MPTPKAGIVPQIVCAVLATFVVAATALAAEIRTDFEAVLALGHDSNPLRISGDGVNGWFSDLRVDGGVVVRRGSATSFFARVGAERRDHDSAASNADAWGLGFRTGVSTKPPPLQGRGPLSLAAGVLYSLDRSTYTDRETGAAYEVEVDPPSDPPLIVPVPARFDSERTGAFFDMRWRPGTRMRFSLDVLVERTDFLKDYSEAGLASLDYRSLSVEPGLQYRINELVTVGASLAFTDLDYDSQSAVDSGGDEVSGVRRQYRYLEPRLGVRVSPTRNLRIDFGLRAGDRSDRYAGYYDYNSRVTYLALDRKLGTRDRLQVFGSLTRLSYDRATFQSADDDEALLASRVRRLIGRYDRTLRRRLGMFVEFGAHRADSSDPVFAYDRRWMLTGITIRR